MTAPRRTVAPKTKKPEAIRQMQERPEHIRMMVYADPGTGKTPFVGTSPGKVLLLNADGPDGPESARVYSDYKGDIWDIRNYKDLDDAYEYIYHSPGAYDWVWLDSITLFQELGMDNIMRDLVAEKPTRSLYLPDKPQYMLNQNHLGDWLRKMDGLPVNFGVTAHAMRIEDEDDGTITYMPSIQGGSGKMAVKVCGYMSIVGRLYVVTRKNKERKEETFRVLQTARDSKWYAKNRLGGLEGKLASPTMPKVLAGINGEKPVTSAAPRRRRVSTK